MRNNSGLIVLLWISFIKATQKWNHRKKRTRCSTLKS